MALVITDATPQALDWRHLLSVQHPHLLLVAAVLCLPALPSLSRIFLPLLSSGSSRQSDSWWDWMSSPQLELEWLGIVYVLLPLFLLGLMLACYGALVLGAYWLLLQFFI